MIDFSKILGFEWDKGNIHKSYQKHGISPNQTEEVFLDTQFKYQIDYRHSQEELRYFGIGRIQNEQWLFVSFTIRKGMIRIISVRPMHQKERRKYGK